MASSFGPEDPGSIPDAAKDPPSACGLCARKIRGSESPWSVASNLPWVLSLEKISLRFRDI